MKRTKLFAFPLLAVLIMTATIASAFADLTAAQIAAHFNSLNGNNTGFRFDSSSVTGQSLTRTFTTATGYNNVDVSAYNSPLGGMSGGKSYFTSFCANTNYGTTSAGTARLSYNSNGTSQNASGTFLSVGSAYLYMLYATGAITNSSLDSLLRTMNSATTAASVSTNWSSNSYLARLIAINPNENFWIGNYSALTDYSFMGDNYVFIMNLFDLSGAKAQDVYYLANAKLYDDGNGPGGGSGVPEPATLLLWTLGGLGLACTSQARKRRMTKRNSV